MKKIIKLNESDLLKIINKVISEQDSGTPIGLKFGQDISTSIVGTIKKQFGYLKEQNIINKFIDSYGEKVTLGEFVIRQYGKFKYFVDEITPRIEKMAKMLYPANDIVKKDQNLKSSPQYRELKDKEDAYAHQLASAVAASIFGPVISDLIGKANEIKGGLRMFFKGAPSKGIEKYEQFTSGWKEDNLNNSIGIELGKKYPNRDMYFFSNLVVKNIENKNYYDSTGNKKK